MSKLLTEAKYKDYRNKAEEKFYEGFVSNLYSTGAMTGTPHLGIRVAHQEWYLKDDPFGSCGRYLACDAPEGASFLRIGAEMAHEILGHWKGDEETIVCWQEPRVTLRDGMVLVESYVSLRKRLMKPFCHEKDGE